MVKFLTVNAVVILQAPIFIPNLRSSAKNKLPFMMLNPLDQTAEKQVFPAETQKKWTFLQKEGLSRRKMPVSRRKVPSPTEKCGFRGAHGRKLQEGFRAQESTMLANCQEDYRRKAFAFRSLLVRGSDGRKSWRGVGEGQEA